LQERREEVERKETVSKIAKKSKKAAKKTAQMLSKKKRGALQALIDQPKNPSP
jgi:hypothetical protein